ncbi:S8 family serine peptidase [Planctomycetota bacterium]|nr:S8 family serine peptidase [Planctomycetota bacterium]
MKLRITSILTAVAAGVAVSSTSFALDESVEYIRGNTTRNLLGDGTGVVVGILDSGIDATHPALAGFTSDGMPRLKTADNFVTYENTTDDLYGHGTAVASVVASNNNIYTGLAPDVQLINARVLDKYNSFADGRWVGNGIAFAVNNDADILNLSLGYDAPNSDGTNTLDLMLDWATYERGTHVVSAAGNIKDSYKQVRSPGSIYNGFSVARTTNDFSKIHSNSCTAYTQDGRMKPDLAAPGTSIKMASHNHESLDDFAYTASGTSFAAPHVAGLLAQQLEYGRNNNLSTSPMVTKATMMNATNPVIDKSNKLQAPAYSYDDNGIYTVTKPLSVDAGSGQIDALNLYNQYAHGEYGPGQVNSIGWDLFDDGLQNNDAIEYIIDSALELNSQLAVTLNWLRKVTRTDNGNGIVDIYDSYNYFNINNLDLQILKDGQVIAQSISSVDNIEQLRITVDDEFAQYSFRVLGTSINNTPEDFAIAWSSVAIPEPTTLLLLMGLSLSLTTARTRS